jgi:hypothetical protein
MKMLNLGRFALAASGLAVAVAMPAHAQLATNTFATQASITVVPTTVESSARTSAIAVSGNNVTVASLGSISADGATITAPGAGTITNPGDAFTYNVSVVDEDTVAATTLSSGAVSALPDYSTQTTQVGGAAGTATVTALSSGEATAVIGTGVGTTVSVLQQASLSVFK